MPSNSKEPSSERLKHFLARAEEAFVQRQTQRAEAPAAVREYRDAQQATLDNMRRLKALREARTAAAPPAKR